MRGYPGVMERKLTQKCPNLVNDENKSVIEGEVNAKME